MDLSKLSNSDSPAHDAHLSSGCSPAPYWRRWRQRLWHLPVFPGRNFKELEKETRFDFFFAPKKKIEKTCCLVFDWVFFLKAGKMIRLLLESPHLFANRGWGSMSKIDGRNSCQGVSFGIRQGRLTLWCHPDIPHVQIEVCKWENHREIIHCPVWWHRSLASLRTSSM